MKKIAILGSTGSVGCSTLQVASCLQNEISIVGLAAHSNVEKLSAQAIEFGSRIVSIFDESKVKELKLKLPPHVKVLGGMEGLHELVSDPEINFVVVSMSGIQALAPTLTAIKCKKGIGLANKEILVSAGEMLINFAKQHNVALLPIDSEHSAIFQCLEGENPDFIKRIILTASGGPFRNYSEKELEKVSIRDALAHPTWRMGNKITIDSSTLMNKGLEMIEASYLFDQPSEKIEIVIHPQSIIHSMVEFEDTSIKAQMGMPHMSLSIQYAIMYPKRMKGPLKEFDFTKQHTLEFFPPNREKFKAISLAYSALVKKRSYPCVLNAANEVFVSMFLEGMIDWTKIVLGSQKILERHVGQKLDSYEDVIEVDRETRIKAMELTL